MSRKKFKHINKKSQSGQALIEFVLGLMIVISFFFFYVKMAAIFAVGNYIHYATFMAARAYSSGATSPDEQTANAEAVLQKMLVGRYKALLKPSSDSTGSIPGATVGGGQWFQEDAALDFWNQGVTYSYETKIALYPWSKGNQAITMKLTSESWMRKEDSEAECNAKKARIQGGVRLPNIAVEWDNGC